MNTHLRAAHDRLQPQPRRRAQRSAHVGRGPAALRPCQEVHPRHRRPDVGRVLPARREQDRSLEFYARPDRGAGEGQGQGQGGRPVEFLPARCRDRRRPEEPRLRLYRGRARQKSAGLGNHELLGAGHRQHGSAGARRHQGAEGEVAEAAAGRRNPLRLCDDRTQRRLLRRQEHLDHRKTRRRRMGDQRREILHLRPRRSRAARS